MLLFIYRVNKQQVFRSHVMSYKSLFTFILFYLGMVGISPLHASYQSPPPSYEESMGMGGMEQQPMGTDMQDDTGMGMGGMEQQPMGTDMQEVDEPAISQEDLPKKIVSFIKILKGEEEIVTGKSGEKQLNSLKQIFNNYSDLSYMVTEASNISEWYTASGQKVSTEDVKNDLDYISGLIINLGRIDFDILHDLAYPSAESQKARNLVDMMKERASKRHKQNTEIRRFESFMNVIKGIVGPRVPHIKEPVGYSLDLQILKEGYFQVFTEALKQHGEDGKLTWTSPRSGNTLTSEDILNDLAYLTSVFRMANKIEATALQMLRSELLTEAVELDKKINPEESHN